MFGFTAVMNNETGVAPGVTLELPGVGDCPECAIVLLGATGIYLAVNNKDAIKRAMGQIVQAANHIPKLTSPDPDRRNKLRKEIREFIKRGRVWANRMSPGMWQDAMNALLDQAEWAVPED